MQFISQRTREKTNEIEASLRLRYKMLTISAHNNQNILLFVPGVKLLQKPSSKDIMNTKKKGILHFL